MSNKSNGNANNLPVFGQNAAVSDQDLPVTRGDLLNFFNNAMQQLVNPALQQLQARIGSVDACLVFLQEVGLEVQGDHVKMNFEEVAKWGKAIRDKQAQEAFDQQAAQKAEEPPFPAPPSN